MTAAEPVVHGLALDRKRIGRRGKQSARLQLPVFHTPRERQAGERIQAKRASRSDVIGRHPRRRAQRIARRGARGVGGEQAGTTIAKRIRVRQRFAGGRRRSGKIREFDPARRVIQGCKSRCPCGERRIAIGTRGKRLAKPVGSQVRIAGQSRLLGIPHACCIDKMIGQGKQTRALRKHVVRSVAHPRRRGTLGIRIDACASGEREQHDERKQPRTARTASHGADELKGEGKAGGVDRISRGGRRRSASRRWISATSSLNRLCIE